ncbi:MAG: hypothetical protein ACWGN1_03810, partial [Desulfobulbales bacterium]
GIDYVFQLPVFHLFLIEILKNTTCIQAVFHGQHGLSTISSHDKNVMYGNPAAGDGPTGNFAMPTRESGKDSPAKVS